MQVRSWGEEDSPGEGNGNPLLCSCLEDPVDSGDWQATVRGITKMGTTEVTQHAGPLWQFGWKQDFRLTSKGRGDFLKS